jgi:cation/acetate symporter
MRKTTLLVVLVLMLLGSGAAVFAQSTAATTLEGNFKLVPAIILIVILSTFVLVGVVNRAKGTKDYWAAGRNISPVGSGMAIASNWMSAASFLGMAAIMYGSGYHGLAYVVGWTGGYVLLLVLMAGQIRRYGKYTAADFIGDRYYSRGLRAAGALLTIFISITYCVGQFAGIGLMFRWILGINYNLTILIGGAVVLTYTLISGMLGVTKNMQVQYVIIIVSFILPLFFIAQKFGYFWGIPQIGYGDLVSDFNTGLAQVQDAVENVLGHRVGILPQPEYALPYASAHGTTAFEWIALCFALMLGTAGLPHVIQRFYVVPKAKDARWSVVWGLFFICLLYWNAPVYSAFAKILSSSPDMGALSKDAIVVYTAQLADILPIIVAFLAAGAVSAAFSTVSGLLMAGASAFSHDFYFNTLKPDASEKTQMIMARLGTVFMAIIVTGIALLKLGLIANLVAVAFSLAACTIFPLFLLGIWWSGSNRQGAWAGVIVGAGIALVAITYFVAGNFGTALPGAAFMKKWLNPWYFAWIGAPLAIIANVVVSLATGKDTPEEIKEFLATKVHNEIVQRG